MEGPEEEEKQEEEKPTSDRAQTCVIGPRGGGSRRKSSRPGTGRKPVWTDPGGGGKPPGIGRTYVDGPEEKTEEEEEVTTRHPLYGMTPAGTLCQPCPSPFTSLPFPSSSAPSPSTTSSSSFPPPAGPICSSPQHAPAQSCSACTLLPPCHFKVL